MHNAQLIPALLLLAAIALVVLALVARSVWRELSGLGDEDEARSARKTEERKNERIRREIESWRDGE